MDFTILIYIVHIYTLIIYSPHYTLLHPLHFPPFLLSFANYCLSNFKLSFILYILNIGERVKYLSFWLGYFLFFYLTWSTIQFHPFPCKWLDFITPYRIIIFHFCINYTFFNHSFYCEQSFKCGDSSISAVY